MRAVGAVRNGAVHTSKVRQQIMLGSRQYVEEEGEGDFKKSNIAINTDDKLHSVRLPRAPMRPMLLPFD